MKMRLIRWQSSSYNDMSYGLWLFCIWKNAVLPPVKALMRIAGRYIYRHATRLTVPSQKAAGFPFVQGLRDRILVVPNGMEIEKYQKQLSEQERHSLRMSLGIEDTTGLLVAVTRMSKEKNIRELISFLPKLLKKTKRR